MGYSKICFRIGRGRARESQNVRHPACIQNIQISTVDVKRCVKLSSHEVILEEQAKEWEVFCYRSSLQTGSPYPWDIPRFAFE